VLDALVIGAGPSGSNISSLLASSGLKVRFIDVKERIGIPNHCSGLVEKRVVDMVGEDLVLSRPSVADIITPAGSFSLESEKMYVLDRVALDRKLADIAVASGAILTIRATLLNFRVTDSYVRAQIKSAEGFETVDSRFIIGADGPTSTVRRNLGISPPKLLRSVQFDIKGKSSKVKIVMDRSLTPDFFAWEIPSDGEIEVGASGAGSMETVIKMTKGVDIVRKRGGLIPIGPTVLGRDRCFLVGDAAGTNKATTGGGLYGALISGLMLYRAIIGNGDVLQNYRKLWFSSFGSEVLKSYRIRTIIDKFERNYRLWVPLIRSNIKGINRVGDVDYPSKAFLYMLGAMPLRFPLAFKDIVSA